MKKQTNIRTLKLLSDTELKAIDPRLSRCISINCNLDGTAIMFGVGQYKDRQFFAVIYEQTTDGSVIASNVNTFEGEAYESVIKIQNEIALASLRDVVVNSDELKHAFATLKPSQPIALKIKSA